MSLRGASVTLRGQERALNQTRLVGAVKEMDMYYCIILLYTYNIMNTIMYNVLLDIHSIWLYIIYIVNLFVLYQSLFW